MKTTYFVHHGAAAGREKFYSKKEAEGFAKHCADRGIRIVRAVTLEV